MFVVDGPEFTSKILSEMNSPQKKVDFKSNVTTLRNKTLTERYVYVCIG